MQVLSAVLAFGGAVVAVLAGVVPAVLWLVGFVVLTIASERAELAQVWMGPRSETRILWLATGLALALASALVWQVGERLVGVALVTGAGWLLVNDVVRRQLGVRGQRRYIAVALLAGYLNLLVAGVVLTVRGLTAGQGAYDVVVHGAFLGFGMSMVMAHAPVILPAVLGRPLPYRPVLYLPLVLLHVGLVARFTGALAGPRTLWQTGGVMTVAALLAFVVTAAVLVVRR